MERARSELKVIAELMELTGPLSEETKEWIAKSVARTKEVLEEAHESN